MFASITIRVPMWIDLMFVWPWLIYRRWKYGYTYRRINLGEGYWTILDQDDYYRLSKYKWYVNGNGIIVGPGKTRMKSMHREIMDSPMGLLVDHRNGDPFDNRRENLRKATHSQNSCNVQRKRAGCSSQYRGVSWDKKRKYWNVQVVCEGKMVYFGRFKNEIEAAKAYDAAARKYHGEFARLNFPEEQSKKEKGKS
jgi:hypothetical protein